MSEAYIALLAFVVLMVATPGPANLVVMIGGSKQGLRACAGFILGLVSGKILLNIVFGLGFGLVLTNLPHIVTVIKFGGAGYMIWLALRSWNDRPTNGHQRDTYRFGHGLMVHPLNPKAWVMVTLAWSQFAPALGGFGEFGGFGVQLTLVTATFAAVQLVFHTLWCAAGAVTSKALQGSLLLTRILISLTILVVIWALSYDPSSSASPV